MIMTDDSALRCPVCLDISESPKVLQCGHSFCAGCCENLINGRSITCPECRQDTAILAKGLPTNFKLQDMIQQYTSKKSDGKPYQCSRCHGACTAEEAWVQKENPGKCGYTAYCYRCFIKYSDTNRPDHHLLTPATADSIADKLKSQKLHCNNQKQQLQEINKEQKEWLCVVKNSAQTIRNDFVLAIEQLEKTCMEHTVTFEAKLGRLKDCTQKLEKRPNSLCEMADYDHMCNQLSSELSQYRSSYISAVDKTQEALNVFTKRFHQFLNIDDMDTETFTIESKQRPKISLLVKIEAMKKNTALVNGDTWYLISLEWYRKMVSYLRGSGKHPGPIDNSNLRSGIFLKENLQEESDYISLPKNAWRMLTAEYDLTSRRLTPIARQVVDLKVEVYQLTLKLAMSNRTQEDDFSILCCNRLTTLGELKDEAMIRLSLRAWRGVCLFKKNNDQLEPIPNDRADATLQDLEIIDQQIIIVDKDHTMPDHPTITAEQINQMMAATAAATAAAAEAFAAFQNGTETNIPASGSLGLRAAGYSAFYSNAFLSAYNNFLSRK